MKIKGEKGVTLVALVVTIIVLAIVSGALVFTLNGTNGIFTTTKNMQRNYTEKEEETKTKKNRTINSWGKVLNKTEIDPALEDRMNGGN